jgi:hypothetical protein
MRRPTCTALVLVAVATGATAELQLPKWFGDNMVLQTNSEYGARSFINGLAKPDEAVDVQVGTAHFPATAGPDGSWQVMINHGSGDITVQTASGDTATAKNSAGGDVFFCSGQSNSVWYSSIWRCGAFCSLLQAFAVAASLRVACRLASGPLGCGAL